MMSNLSKLGKNGWSAIGGSIQRWCRRGLSTSTASSSNGSGRFQSSIDHDEVVSGFVTPPQVGCFTSDADSPGLAVCAFDVWCRKSFLV